MSYEEGFEALKDGDFLTAVPLLEKAARETGFTSNIINHTYTLALHRAGDKGTLADVSFRIACSLVQDDPASAMDYFQRAMFAGLDSKRVRRIGEVLEGWAVPRREARVEWPVKRVAHVVGCLSAGDALTRYVKMLTASLNQLDVRSTIFTTEWAASWFCNPEGGTQSESLEVEAETRIASINGNFAERAQSVSQAIEASGIQIAFYHCSLTEQITARVAAMRPAPIQVNVNHGSEMDADLFDARVHIFQSALERTRFSCPAERIPPASDIERRLELCEPVNRQSMGLESASSISATFGNLHKVAGSGYLRALAEIMKRFPNHFHLFAGAGNVRAMRTHLHSEGVLPRVRFLGHVSDVAPLLNTVDVYLASFPHPGGHSVLEAMAAGKPIVVLRHLSNAQGNSDAELVGVRDLIAPGEADYIEIADRLLRNSELREKHGQRLRDRFRAEFRPERLGERYKAFTERLVHFSTV